MTRQTDFGWTVGQTVEYQRFIQLLSPETKATAVIGPLDLVIEAEVQGALADAGRDVVTRLQEMLAKDRPNWRALDKLLTDVDAYLDLLPDSDAQRLLDRVKRARVVLGLVDGGG